MSVFIAISTSDSSGQLDAAVVEHVEVEDRYELAHGSGWLIRFYGTTTELANRLGITGQAAGEKPAVPSALVTLIAGYHGRGPSEQWEWLKSRMES